MRLYVRGVSSTGKEQPFLSPTRFTDYITPLHIKCHYVTDTGVKMKVWQLNCWKSRGEAFLFNEIAFLFCVTHCENSEVQIHIYPNGTKIIVTKFVLTRFVVQGMWIAAKLRHELTLTKRIFPDIMFTRRCVQFSRMCFLALFVILLVAPNILWHCGKFLYYRIFWPTGYLYSVDRTEPLQRRTCTISHGFTSIRMLNDYTF